MAVEHPFRAGTKTPRGRGGASAVFKRREPGSAASMKESDLSKREKVILAAALLVGFAIGFATGPWMLWAP